MNSLFFIEEEEALDVDKSSSTSDTRGGGVGVGWHSSGNPAHVAILIDSNNTKL